METERLVQLALVGNNTERQELYKMLERFNGPELAIAGQWERVDTGNKASKSKSYAFKSTIEAKPLSTTAACSAKIRKAIKETSAVRKPGVRSWTPEQRETQRKKLAAYWRKRRAAKK